jgi:hypothetical protein
VERDAAVLRGIETESAYRLSGNVDDDGMASIGHQYGIVKNLTFSVRVVRAF